MSTERVRRKTAQAAHAEQAKQEIVNLVPPKGAEKAAQIEANKTRDLARFGTDGKGAAVHRAQAANKVAAEAEAAALPHIDTVRPALGEPGTQVDLNTARRMAMAADREEINQIDTAARAAGRAVREVLNGMENPALERHQKARAIADVKAQQALPKQEN